MYLHTPVIYSNSSFMSWYMQILYIYITLKRTKKHLWGKEVSKLLAMIITKFNLTNHTLLKNHTKILKQSWLKINGTKIIQDI